MVSPYLGRHSHRPSPHRTSLLQAYKRGFTGGTPHVPAGPGNGMTHPVSAAAAPAPRAGPSFVDLTATHWNGSAINR